MILDFWNKVKEITDIGPFADDQTTKNALKEIDNIQLAMFSERSACNNKNHKCYKKVNALFKTVLTTKKTSFGQEDDKKIIREVSFIYTQEYKRYNTDQAWNELEHAKDLYDKARTKQQPTQDATTDSDQLDNIITGHDSDNNPTAEEPTPKTHVPLPSELESKTTAGSRAKTDWSKDYGSVNQAPKSSSGVLSTHSLLATKAKIGGSPKPTSNPEDIPTDNLPSRGSEDAQSAPEKAGQLKQNAVNFWRNSSSRVNQPPTKDSPPSKHGPG